MVYCSLRTENELRHLYWWRRHCWQNRGWTDLTAVLWSTVIRQTERVCKSFMPVKLLKTLFRSAKQVVIIAYACWKERREWTAAVLRRL